MQDTILRMEHIVKEFSGVRVLKDVHFDLKAGEVHALIGENGAGKSTLIKILGGVYFPEGGEIYIGDKKMRFTSAQDALHAGVGIIYQEFNLVPTLSIAENIFLGKELTRKGVKLDRKDMVKQANELMATLGFANVDCNEQVSRLSVAQQQMVEIAKALFNDSKILVMDEPTAVLTEYDSKKLFEMIATLKEKGVGIIYVSHRLEEVLSLSDRITVLRDGELIDVLDNTEKNVTKDQLVSLMVGRKLEQYYPSREARESDEIVMDVQGLTKEGLYRNVSFQLHKGEILGITGLVGAKRTEVVKSIFGAIHADSGKVMVGGEEVTFSKPSDAMKHGIAFVPEDRKKEGLFLDASVANNMYTANYDKVTSHGIFRKKLKEAFLKEYFGKLNIRPADPDKISRDLSGGNQQKVIIAKWMAIHPKIMILDEPTRGIDIGAKAEIYKLMDQLAQNGCSIIMVSSEMNEVIGMCDRVIVMSEGRVTAEFTHKEITQEKIMTAASGNK